MDVMGNTVGVGVEPLSWTEERKVAAKGYVSYFSSI